MNKLQFSLEDRDVYSYSSYMNKVENLLTEGKTTGPNQSELLTNFTQLNERRTKRVFKRFVLDSQLEKQITSINTKQTWLLITEAWCGDAAHNLPALAKIAEINPKIAFSIILRDDNLDIMDEFKTNGGRSIPKLIALNNDNDILFTWGPRPNEAQEFFNDLKKTQTHDEVSKQLQIWYSKNKSKAIQKEILELTSSLVQSSSLYTL